MHESLRLRINIIKVKMSPDFRSSFISVSTIGNLVEKRKCFTWLTSHSKAIKHALAKRYKHMKCIPDIFFKHVDISAKLKLKQRIEEEYAKLQLKLNNDNNDDGNVNDNDNEEVNISSNDEKMYSTMDNHRTSTSTSTPSGMIGGLDFDYIE